MDNDYKGFAALMPFFNGFHLHSAAVIIIMVSFVVRTIIIIIIIRRTLPKSDFYKLEEDFQYPFHLLLVVFFVKVEEMVFESLLHLEFADIEEVESHFFLSLLMPTTKKFNYAPKWFATSLLSRMLSNLLSPFIRVSG